MLDERYASWNSGLGQEIERGKHDFASLEKLMLEKGDAAVNKSGRQELLENIVNQFI
jgi:xylose isomerase